jgi:hypothetical protein
VVILQKGALAAGCQPVVVSENSLDVQAAFPLAIPQKI